MDRRVRLGVTAKTLVGCVRLVLTYADVRRTEETSSDRTLVGCIWSVLTYVDVRRTEEMISDRTLGEFGRA